MTTCPECGLEKGHRLDCKFAMREVQRSKRPPIPNYSALENNRGPETMFGKVVPLMPVTEEDGRPAVPLTPAGARRATSLLKE